MTGSSYRGETGEAMHGPRDASYQAAVTRQLQSVCTQGCQRVFRSPTARTRAVSGLACFACTLQSVLCRRVVAHLYVLFDEGYRIGPMDKEPFGIGLQVPDEATPARDGV